MCVYIYILFTHYFYFWRGWVFIAVQAFFHLWRAGATLLFWCPSSSLQGLSCCRAWALGCVGSVFAAPSSKGHAPQLWCSSLAALWHVGFSRSGIRLVTSTLAGGFFTTELPGSHTELKSYSLCACVGQLATLKNTS